MSSLEIDKMTTFEKMDTQYGEVEYSMISQNGKPNVNAMSHRLKISSFFRLSTPYYNHNDKISKIGLANISH